MNEKTISLAPALTGIEDSKAKQIEAVFAPMVAMLKEFEDQYAEVINLERNKENCAKAKTLRIAIGKIRIEAEKVRREQKEQYLIAGKAIDGVNNILKFAVSEKEDSLKEMETHFERIEAEKIEKIKQERISALEEIGVTDVMIDLGNMEEEVWKNFFAGNKANYDARIEAERKVEQDRIERERREELENKRRYQCSLLAIYIDNFESTVFADLSDDEYSKLVEDAKAKRTAAEAEQERIQKENERLKKEAEKREAKEKADREARERAEAERLEEERKKREAAEEEARLLREQAEKEQTEKLRKEEEGKEAERQRLSAPDKEKLLIFAKTVKNMDYPSLETAGAQEILKKVIIELNNIITMIEENSINL